MRTFIKHTIACVFSALLLIMVGSFLLANTLVYAEEDTTLVYDKASLLTPEQINSLQDHARSIGDSYNTTIYILTDSDSQKLSRQTYMENFADSEQVTNSIIIFVNMDPDNRGVEIQGYGEDEYRISNPRVESILDVVTPYLADEDYYSAFSIFLEESQYYLEQPSDINADSSISSDPNYYKSDVYYQKEVRKEALDNSPFSNLLVQIAISLGIAGITLGIMAYNSGGRTTVNERTYLDSNNSRVIAHRDQYIRTTTTRVHRPKQTSSSGGFRGGGGGGVSSGGRSHSGGGRSF